MPYHLRSSSRRHACMHVFLTFSIESNHGWSHSCCIYVPQPRASQPRTLTCVQKNLPRKVLVVRSRFPVTEFILHVRPRVRSSTANTEERNSLNEFSVAGIPPRHLMATKFRMWGCGRKQSVNRIDTTVLRQRWSKNRSHLENDEKQLRQM